MRLKDLLKRKFFNVSILTFISLTVVYFIVFYSIVHQYWEYMRRNFESAIEVIRDSSLNFLMRGEEPLLKALDGLIVDISFDRENAIKYIDKFVSLHNKNNSWNLPSCSYKRVDEKEIPNFVELKLDKDLDYYITRRITNLGFIQNVYIKVDNIYYLIAFNEKLTDESNLLRNIQRLSSMFDLWDMKVLSFTDPTSIDSTSLSCVFSLNGGHSIGSLTDEEIKQLALKAFKEKQTQIVSIGFSVNYVDFLSIESEKVSFEPLIIYLRFNFSSFFYPIVSGITVTVVFMLFIFLIVNNISKKFSDEISEPFSALVKSMKKSSAIREFDDSEMPDTNIDEVRELVSEYHNMRTELSAVMQELRASNEDLEQSYKELEELSKKLENSYLYFARQLATIAEKYDEDTGDHIDRVGELSAFLGQKIGLLPDIVEKLRIFAPLHDIGKILIPKEILNKQGRLSEEEFEEMKKHTIYGANILGDSEYFLLARNIALYHHEKYDGNGYPYGLSGEEIPIEARIVALVDVYDALRSKRPYKDGLSHEEAVEIITKGDDRTRPEHFDPKLLEIFVENSEQIKKLWEEMSMGNKSSESND
ncbi:MAG: HD-GYP domain-containing protein [Fervidobacterium sp.]